MEAIRNEVTVPIPTVVRMVVSLLRISNIVTVTFKPNVNNDFLKLYARLWSLWKLSGKYKPTSKATKTSELNELHRSSEIPFLFFYFCSTITLFVKNFWDEEFLLILIRDIFGRVSSSWLFLLQCFDGYNLWSSSRVCRAR